jgi:TPR repeat protein
MRRLSLVPMLAARTLLLALFGAVLGPALAASPPPPEPALRQELQDARWPADIVAVAERYLASYPQGPLASEARADLERARNTKRLLERSDIRLYRGDFLVRGATVALQDDVRKAAVADKEAAGRMARVYRDGEGGIEASSSRYVGWLQYSAALGNAPASYELAVYYRKADQPALAAPYEARAEELGFKPPPSLDNVRK